MTEALAPNNTSQGLPGHTGHQPGHRLGTHFRRSGVSLGRDRLSRADADQGVMLRVPNRSLRSWVRYLGQCQSGALSPPADLDEEAWSLTDPVWPDVVIRHLPARLQEPKRRKRLWGSYRMEVRVRAGCGPVVLIDRDVIDDGPIDQPGFSIISAREHDCHPVTSSFRLGPKLAATPPRLVVFCELVTATLFRLVPERPGVQERVDAGTGKAVHWHSLSPSPDRRILVGPACRLA
jgi:hypothetical protein